MATERVQILDMLASGKISVEEAERLLAAVETQGPAERAASEGTPLKAADSKPKYLRVVVNGPKEERVNIRVPLQLIRAGASLAAFMPKEARLHVEHAFKEKGLDFDVANIPPEKLEALIEAIAELTVDVEAPDANVRVFCE